MAETPATPKSIMAETAPLPKNYMVKGFRRQLFYYFSKSTKKNYKLKEVAINRINICIEGTH